MVDSSHKIKWSIFYTKQNGRYFTQNKMIDTSHTKQNGLYFTGQNGRQCTQSKLVDSAHTSSYTAASIRELFLAIGVIG